MGHNALRELTDLIGNCCERTHFAFKLIEDFEAIVADCHACFQLSYGKQISFRIVHHSGLVDLDLCPHDRVIASARSKLQIMVRRNVELDCLHCQRLLGKLGNALTDLISLYSSDVGWQWELNQTLPAVAPFNREVFEESNGLNDVTARRFDTRMLVRKIGSSRTYVNISRIRFSISLDRGNLLLNLIEIVLDRLTAVSQILPEGDERISDSLHRRMEPRQNATDDTVFLLSDFSAVVAVTRFE
ncbi:hypothetical protein D3C86_1505310 [compost metagenome]